MRQDGPKPLVGGIHLHDKLLMRVRNGEDRSGHEQRLRIPLKMYTIRSQSMQGGSHGTKVPDETFIANPRNCRMCFLQLGGSQLATALALLSRVHLDVVLLDDEAQKRRLLDVKVALFGLHEQRIVQ